MCLVDPASDFEYGFVLRPQKQFIVTPGLSLVAQKWTYTSPYERSSTSGFSLWNHLEIINGENPKVEKSRIFQLDFGSDGRKRSKWFLGSVLSRVSAQITRFHKCLLYRA